MKKLIYILFILTCFYSCEMLDKDYGGYVLSENPEYGNELALSFYDTSAYHQWENGSRSLHKGVFLKYVYDNKIDTLFVWEGSTVIEAHINDIKYDNNYIIVDQKPLDSIWGPIINADYAPIRKKQFENARDAINFLENSNIHNLWIINKDLKKVYGPFTKQEYLQKRKELRIPAELQLDFEKDNE